MKRNFIAFILACSAGVTVSESAMASDKPFEDMENHFVARKSTPRYIGNWECGAYIHSIIENIHGKHIKKTYKFIQDVPGYDFRKVWSVFQNPETKAYIAVSGFGYFMSVRKVAAE